MRSFSLTLQSGVMVLGLLLGSPLVSWGQPQNPQVPAPAAPEAQNPAPLNPAPQNPSAQNPQPITPPKPQQGAVPTAGGAPVDSGTYKVGPADVLLIRVWNEPAFTGPRGGERGREHHFALGGPSGGGR